MLKLAGSIKDWAFWTRDVHCIIFAGLQLLNSRLRIDKKRT